MFTLGASWMYLWILCLPININCEEVMILKFVIRWSWINHRKCYPQKMEMPLLLNIWREGITFGHASELVNIVGQACTYGKETWCPRGLTSYKDFKGVNWFGSTKNWTKLDQIRQFGFVFEVIVLVWFINPKLNVI